MYQMISYAYRRGTNKVILMYPNTSEKLADDYVFKIQKANEKDEIKIKVIDIPFWSIKGQSTVKESLLVKLDNALRNDF